MMEANKRLNRETEYALMSAGAAGIVSIIMLATFLELFTWLFVPSVMIMVFVSAYFAFRRQMRGKGALNRDRIFKLAAEIGTLSHFYTFALYFPLNDLIYDYRGFNLDSAGIYLGSILIFGIVSIVFFVWIAVPMYVGVGHILKTVEKNVYLKDHLDVKPILDSIPGRDV